MKLRLPIRQAIGGVIVTVPLTMLIASLMDYAFAPGAPDGYGVLAFMSAMLTMFFVAGMWICLLIKLTATLSEIIEKSDNKFIDFFFKE